MSQQKVPFESSEPRPAPPSESPATRLRWRPQPMVQWFDPVQLAGTAVRAVLSSIFGAYADKREVQAALSRDGAQPVVYDYSADPELWVDYVSDLGDGFDSTYTLAWLLGRERLAGPDARTGPAPGGDAGALAGTERGRVLIMGGDQVYPTASRTEYENRLSGPYEASLPSVADDAPQPHLFAVPGNHDWYDGLTAFTRLFCQERDIGAWKTRQTRSYFALKLPHRWWLLGIDIQLASDIDKPQLDYFRAVAKTMKEGDRVILCTAQPAWVHVAESPRAYENLAFFERKVLCDCKARLVLTLTGDLHHYARYGDSRGERHKITSGGGGAYLYGTHLLPRRLELPEAEPGAPGEAPRTETFTREAVYPEPSTSRALRGGALRLGLRNPRFMIFLGVLYTVYTWFLQEASRVHLPAIDPSGTRDLLRWLSAQPFSNFFDVVATSLQISLRAPLMLALSAIFVWGLYTFCTPDPGRPRAYKWIGALHGGAHLLLILLLTWLFAWFNLVMLEIETPEINAVVFLVEMMVAGGSLGALLFGMALLPGVNFNEAYSSQHIEHWKNFLRLHVDRAGNLTVYPVGIDRVRRWEADPAAAPGAPFFRPRDGKPPRAHLIEDPFTLSGPAGERVRAPAMFDSVGATKER